MRCKLARAVAPINPMWLEDPMPPFYSESWSKLTEESPVPILTGENLYLRRGFMPFILNQGCHIVQHRYSQGRRAAGIEEDCRSGGTV